MDSPYSRALSQEFQAVLRCKHAHLIDRSEKKSRLSRFAQALLEFLTGENTLSIKKQQSAQGETIWTVYDCATDTRRTFDSQQAVRVWLETRYYQ